jgi:hypothetical protein
MVDKKEFPLDYPEPPPQVSFLDLRRRAQKETRIIRSEQNEYVWNALRMYLKAIELHGRPYPGWEPFERSLAEQFAVLLVAVRGLPTEDSRRQLMTLFLDAQNFGNKRGRRRKDKAKLRIRIHGQRMVQLGEDELAAAWNMKRSLEFQKTGLRERLEKSHFAEDVIRAVLSPKATFASSLATVYAERNHLSYGTARNALRAYQKLPNK